MYIFISALNSTTATREHYGVEEEGREQSERERKEPKEN
jgi:hypothetical protein